MASIIKGVDIHREFPSGDTVVQVLKGINVEMEENALTILKGRSGSGKTTLIKRLHKSHKIIVMRFAGDIFPLYFSLLPWWEQ